MLASAAPPPTIRVVVNDRPLQVLPLEEHGRVLVPMRAIFEALGARVDYDGADQSIDATSPNHRVHLTIGSTAATVDGRPVALDVPPRIVADRTYVPLRFVSTSLGANVGYDQRAQLVSVTLPPVSPVSQQPSITFVPLPQLQPPLSAGVVGYAPQYQELQLSVNGRWFTPGSPINVQLIAPPGGQAYVFLCTSSWRYAMYSAPQSQFYNATLYAPNDQRIPSCSITAMYVAWNGAVSYVPYPVFISLVGPGMNPTPVPSSIPSPAPTPTPVRRHTEPVGRRSDETPARTPAPTSKPQQHAEPRVRATAIP